METQHPGDRAGGEERAGGPPPLITLFLKAPERAQHLRKNKSVPRKHLRFLPSGGPIMIHGVEKRTVCLALLSKPNQCFTQGDRWMVVSHISGRINTVTPGDLVPRLPAGTEDAGSRARPRSGPGENGF